MNKETQAQQEQITNEKINSYLKKHVYVKNGVVYTTDNKYGIKND